MSVSLNGVTESVEERGGRLHLDRDWSEGDAVEIRLPMAARLERLPRREDGGAILYGLVGIHALRLLAAENDG